MNCRPSGIAICDCQFRGGIVVSISAYHAEDPGSIPGRGVSSSQRCRFVGQVQTYPAGAEIGLDVVLRGAPRLLSFTQAWRVSL